VEGPVRSEAEMGCRFRITSGCFGFGHELPRCQDKPDVSTGLAELNSAVDDVAGGRDMIAVGAPDG